MTDREEIGHSPQALQMVLPSPSLRQSGVVKVPQLAQETAPEDAVADGGGLGGEPWLT